LGACAVLRLIKNKERKEKKQKKREK